MEISDLAQECIKNALDDVHRAESAYGDIPAVKDSWKSLARSLALTFTFDNVELCVGSRVSREKLADQLHATHGFDPSELTDNMPDVCIWSHHFR